MMNSRQALVTTKGGGVGYIYKPGFVDDQDLESIKMAVDKELSLISNSFYNTSELMSSNTTKIKALYEQITAQLTSLEARVAALEGTTP